MWIRTPPAAAYQYPERMAQECSLDLKNRKDNIPDKTELGLHVPDLGGNGHHSVLVWHHYDILAVGAVGAECVVAAAPHLVAVALMPVGIGVVFGVEILRTVVYLRL